MYPIYPKNSDSVNPYSADEVKEFYADEYMNQSATKPTISLVRPAITKTRLYNFDPLKPHFCIIKLGFTGVYIICLFCLKT